MGRQQFKKANKKNQTNKVETLEHEIYRMFDIEFMKTFRSSARARASIRQIYTQHILSKIITQNASNKKAEQTRIRASVCNMRENIYRPCMFCFSLHRRGTPNSARARPIPSTGAERPKKERAICICGRKLSHYWNISFDSDSINKRSGIHLRQWIREDLFVCLWWKFHSVVPCVLKRPRDLAVATSGRCLFFSRLKY